MPEKKEETTPKILKNKFFINQRPYYIEDNVHLRIGTIKQIHSALIPNEPTQDVSATPVGTPCIGYVLEKQNDLFQEDQLYSDKEKAKLKIKEFYQNKQKEVDKL